MTQYKHCGGAFKARAAAEAIAARRTVNGIASVQEVHLSQVGKWKAEVLARLRIECPNQVWSADITCVRLARGLVYLTAIPDWLSRHVLSWPLSTTRDA